MSKSTNAELQKVLQNLLYSRKKESKTIDKEGRHLHVISHCHNTSLECLWLLQKGMFVYATQPQHTNPAKDYVFPRVSSLLCIYSGTQETVLQSDWLFAILSGDSVLSEVNGRSMSKFDVKPYSLPNSTIFSKFISEIWRITSHFNLEAAVKVSLMFNLGQFSAQRNRAYFHIKHTC